MKVPDPYGLVLAALAVFRAYRFIAEDKVIERPRTWLLDRIDDHDSATAVKVSEFITCPWCVGFYLTLIAWAIWLLDDELAYFLAAPLAVMTLVGALASLLALSDRHNG